MANEQISIDQATAANTAAANATLRKLKEAVEAELGRSRQSARALCDQLVPGALEALAEADPAALSRMKISDFHDLLRAHLTSVQVTGRLVDATQLTALERENAALRKERDELRKQRDGLQSQLQARSVAATMMSTMPVPSLPLMIAPEPTEEGDAPQSRVASSLSAVSANPAPASNDVRLYTLSLIASGEHRWSLIKRALEAAGFTVGKDFNADLDDLVVTYEVTTPRLSYLLDLNDAGRALLKVKTGIEVPQSNLASLLSRLSSPDLAHGALWIAPHLSDVDYEGADIAGLCPALRTRIEGPVFVFGDDNLPEPAEIGSYLNASGGGSMYAVALDRSVNSTLITRFTQAVEDAALLGEAVLYLTNVSALMAGTKNEQGQVWVTTHRLCHRHPVGKGKRS